MANYLDFQYIKVSFYLLLFLRTEDCSLLPPPLSITSKSRFPGSILSSLLFSFYIFILDIYVIVQVFQLSSIMLMTLTICIFSIEFFPDHSSACSTSSWVSLPSSSKAPHTHHALTTTSPPNCFAYICLLSEQ